ncbi:MAG: hypothetical protein V7K27_04325, partial [Nostoc sp.]|uniref:hypothetical protein n=1 Tax=Nostoc sp. TaxID=1180 RepID=UPI002FF477FA
HKALRFIHKALRFIHKALRFIHKALRFIHKALRFIHEAKRLVNGVASHCGSAASLEAEPLGMHSQSETGNEAKCISYSPHSPLPTPHSPLPTNY